MCLTLCGKNCCNSNLHMIQIYAVIVSYYPDIQVLNKTLNSLYSHVDKIHIIDNTPDKAEILNKFQNDKIDIIYLMENKGIAYAQNIGIKKSIEEEADYIILSDQDTVYPDNYVSEMLKCFNDEKVAASGPLFIDSHTGKKQFFIVDGSYRFKKIYPTSHKHEVLQLIASGTMIKTTVLKDTGLMREDLFIDWVDMEWCWRAVKKGYKIIGNADVVILHQHGTDAVEVFSKNITLKTPLRYYYAIRNGIYLALYSDLLNPYLRFLLFIKTVRNIFLFSILTKPVLKSLKYSLLGFCHGLIKNLGKLNEQD